MSGSKTTTETAAVRLSKRVEAEIWQGNADRGVYLTLRLPGGDEAVIYVSPIRQPRTYSRLLRHLTA